MGDVAPVDAEDPTESREDQAPRVPPTSAERLEQQLSVLSSRLESLGAHVEEHVAPLDRQQLSRTIAAELARFDRRATVSVHIRELRHGVVLFDSGGDLPLVPASTQKLLTAAAALDLLGADFTYATRVLADDDVLCLIGEGDPSLLVEDLASLADATVGGLADDRPRRVVVDDTAFSPRYFGPGISDAGPGLAYEAPSGAVSVQYNTVEIHVVGAQVGQAAGVRVSPSPESVQLVSGVRTRAGSGDVWATSSGQSDGATVVVVGGAIAPRKRWSTRRRIHDPAAFAGWTFADQLERAGLRGVAGVERGPCPEGAAMVAEHFSAPMLDLVRDMLRYSNNFYAEQFVRTLGRALTGEPGDWDNGAEAIRRYWEAVGTRDDAVRIVNGSGLTREGQLTTSALSHLLAASARTTGGGASLLDALPVAGEAGTLRARLRRSKGRVRAKTGTLNGVSGLAGVILDGMGTPVVAFGILINVDTIGTISAKRRNQLEDRIVQIVLDALDDWASRAGVEGEGGADEGEAAEGAGEATAGELHTDTPEQADSDRQPEPPTARVD